MKHNGHCLQVSDASFFDSNERINRKVRKTRRETIRYRRLGALREISGERNLCKKFSTEQFQVDTSHFCHRHKRETHSTNNQ